jgi:UDP-N-acetylmuramoylalanine--D-glutamate ligase
VNTNNPSNLRKVCILGLGTTGLAVCRHYLRSSSPSYIDIYVDKMTQKNMEAMLAIDEEFFHRGGVTGHIFSGVGELYLHNADCRLTLYVGWDGLLSTYDQGIVSPGIQPNNPLYQNAKVRCKELIGEPELAYRFSPDHWLAITGTNGKTTTVRLLGQILADAGLASTVAGNIGPTLIDAVNHRQVGEYLVVELSSFQLANTLSIAPEAAILLNITPDHIEWHGNLDDYAKTKKRIYNWMIPEAPVVIDGLSQIGLQIIDECLTTGRRVVANGLSPDDAAGLFGADRINEMTWVDRDGWLWVRIAGTDHRLLKTADLLIKGRHNHLNALAAAWVAGFVGIDTAAVARSLAGFAPLEHRIEAAGEYQSVSFYNDSKATNPEATLMALSAFPDSSIILMVGGQDKGTDLSELASRVLECCRLVICYGAAANRFFEVFNNALTRPGTGTETERSSCQILMARDMHQAFQTAVRLALPDDVILLSPACSSFDEFDSFEQRGLTFKEWVNELRGE